MEYVFTLVMLTVLQTVLGIDNLLYISLEAKKAPLSKQKYVMNMGIGLAILLRIGLLFLIMALLGAMSGSLFTINITGFIEGDFNFHSIIVFLGGGFIIYTAIKEIWHMISLDKGIEIASNENKSINSLMFIIVVMNLVFSFDSILGALALSKDTLAIIISIVISGLLMIWLAEKVSNFLQKHKKFEILGLFILFIIGIMLLSEAGHLAQLKLMGSEIHAMSKGTFYFVLTVVVVIDVVQTKYKTNLQKQQTEKSTKVI